MELDLDLCPPAQRGSGVLPPADARLVTPHGADGLTCPTRRGLCGRSRPQVNECMLAATHTRWVLINRPQHSLIKRTAFYKTRDVNAEFLAMSTGVCACAGSR
ncbi:hypothetical protein EVAR_57305_1 [Eumeta japonica]|uniref:Uncharacterized protein n=1 Tax=Eumeta variegata TaxID=151549 RepID=A0A4C1YKX6_EUMVA|nr:hypothetical protein EVAR_57305_1 [Eumeta japonica]